LLSLRVQLVSFPFLFGVMYGDIGHGTLLTLGALYFIWYEKYYLERIRHGQMEEIMVSDRGIHISACECEQHVTFLHA
jgi:V-type H+-transporting ATPase subunit a